MRKSELEERKDAATRLSEACEVLLKNVKHATNMARQEAAALVEDLNVVYLSGGEVEAPLSEDDIKEKADAADQFFVALRDALQKTQNVHTKSHVTIDFAALKEHLLIFPTRQFKTTGHHALVREQMAPLFHDIGAAGLDVDLGFRRSPLGSGVDDVGLGFFSLCYGLRHALIDYTAIFKEGRSIEENSRIDIVMMDYMGTDNLGYFNGFTYHFVRVHFLKGQLEGVGLKTRPIPEGCLAEAHAMFDDYMAFEKKYKIPGNMAFPFLFETERLAKDLARLDELTAASRDGRGRE